MWLKGSKLVAYESLQIKNMVRNHCLAKSISDAGWYQFRMWIEYYAKVFGRIAVAVKPQYTSTRLVVKTCQASWIDEGRIPVL